MLHACDRKAGLIKKIGLIRQSENLAIVENTPCGLKSCGHDKMALVTVEPGQKDYASLIELSWNLKDFSREGGP